MATRKTGDENRIFLNIRQIELIKKQLNRISREMDIWGWLTMIVNFKKTLSDSRIKKKKKNNQTENFCWLIR